MNNKRNIIFFLLLVIPFISGLAQLPVQIGDTYLETFRGKCGSLEKSQVWSITSGNESYMFFASNNGLGVYDGVRWEVNNTTEGLVMRSLYFDSKTNTLYCGAVNQFGKWTQDQYGKFEYTPLWINQEKNMYMEFWRIDAPAVGGKIFAQSHQSIISYDPQTQKTETIRTSDGLRYMHIVSGDIWVQDNDDLYKLDSKNEFVKMAHIKDRIVHIAKREIDKKIILFLEHEGIFVFDNDLSKLTPLNAKANTILSKAKIFAVTENKTGQYLVGTTREGLYVMGSNGNIVKNIGEARGLPTSTVLSVTIDNHNNIWMGLDGGIATLDTGRKETYFSPKPSIGNVRSIVPVDNNIYIGSNQGLFKLTNGQVLNSIDGTSGSIWSMNNVGGELFFNHDLGLFNLQNDSPVRVKEGGATTLVQSLNHPAYLVGGDYYGLSLYQIVDGKMKHIAKIKNYAGTARYIQFDKLGYLWIIIPKEGFARLTLSEDMQSVEDIKKYDMASVDGANNLLLPTIDNQLVFYDGAIPYAYDAQSQELVEDKSVMEIFHLCGAKLTSLKQFDDIFWYQTSNDIGYISRKGNRLEKYSGIFSRIYNKRISPAIAKVDANTYAAGYQNGIAFYQLGEKSNNHLTIRMVEAFGVGEPIYYNLNDKRFDLPNNKKIINIYPINLNADQLIEYRILEIDSVWVKEKIDNYLTLTHLESGSYTIQLRNADDADNTATEILVTVAPPWYISNMMILLYFIVLCGIIFLVSLFFKRKNEKEKRRIERTKQAQVESLEKENLIQSQRILELEKDNLKIQLDEKDKRLAFITMNGVKRNNLMNELKKEIQETENYEQSKEAKSIIRKTIKKIEQELDNNEDWEVFEQYFNIVFGGLLENLALKYPQLTQGDLKLLAYLKLNLNNKEIANLLNISYRSVEMAKYRLRKKINLDANDNFNSILNENKPK